MDDKIAIKILELNKNNEIPYFDKIREMERLADNTPFEHTNIFTNAKYGKRNQYILEAYKVLNNFKSRKWVSSDEDIVPLPNNMPVVFEILTSEGKYLKYSLYNEDQIENTNIKVKKHKLIINDNVQKTQSGSHVENVSNLQDAIKNCIKTTARKYEIFIYRYGLEDKKYKTLEEAANHFQISRERVRQIIAKVIRIARIKYCKQNDEGCIFLLNFINQLKKINENLVLSESKFRNEIKKYNSDICNPALLNVIQDIAEENITIIPEPLKILIEESFNDIDIDTINVDTKNIQTILKRGKKWKEFRNNLLKYDFSEVEKSELLDCKTLEKYKEDIKALVTENILFSVNRIRGKLKNYNIAQANEIYEIIEPYYGKIYTRKYYKADYEEWYNKFINSKIMCQLKSKNFDEARNEIENFQNNTNICEIIIESLKFHRQNIKTILIDESENNADKYYASIKDFYKKYYSEDEYNEWKNNFIKQYFNIIEKLKKFEFATCDELYSNNKQLTEYKHLKSLFVKRYMESIEIAINEEQSNAISQINTTLLTARAGSGKTSTIVGKTIYEINKYNVDPNNILILAFNTNAANEISYRIRKKLKFECFNNARTFHSLAYSIIQPQKDVLYDNVEQESKKNLSNFVQKLFREKIWSPVFHEMLYNYFRKECEELSELHFDNKETYYEYRRNKKQVTLKGEQVKSLGEKYIADYLFEHNINYVYEKQIGIQSGALYRPDFTILYNDNDYVLEHWGINEDDQTGSVPDYWTGTREEYESGMKWKREYLKNRQIKLIETSIKDLEAGREEFEKILEKRLNQYGIKGEKRSRKDLINCVVEEKKTKITQMFLSYIRLAKKNDYSPEKIAEILNKEDNLNLNRTQVFLMLANKVYREYEKALKESDKNNFDDWIKEATNKVIETKGNCDIYINHKPIKLSDIKWIMIDEYQDFSLQFYKLIDAIKKFNPKLKLFCVGDDWQAINGFAGSDLKFFYNFEKYFLKHETLNLTYNHRSGEAVVETGNNLMANKGIPAKCFFKNKPSSIDKMYIDDVKFNIFNEFNQKYILNKNFYSTANKYLKLCHEIICKNPYKTILIMSRTKNLEYNVTLSEFNTKLRDCFRYKNIYDKNVQVGTVHSFKGREADIAIILDVTNRNFPLVHPNIDLYEIFGRSASVIIEEEKRLFYVAITRARENIYFLTEKNIESEYLLKLL